MKCCKQAGLESLLSLARSQLEPQLNEKIKSGDFQFVEIVLSVAQLDLRPEGVIDLNRTICLSQIKAAEYGQTEIVKFLIQIGAKIDERDMLGNTALMAAARCGHLQIVKLLLGHGAEVDSKNDNGMTPLIAASQTGHWETVEALLVAGANGLNADVGGNTALNHALFYRRAKVVRVLIQAMPNVLNSRGGSMFTPLMLAAKYGNTRMVELLLGLGADTGLKARPAKAL